MPKTKVTRDFLLNLADEIYNPKTRKFLRLCDGTLQNGPDPTDDVRPMHCGLGELYFAMTGKQPKADGVNERDVIDLAVARSALAGGPEKAVAASIKAIEDLPLPGPVIDDLVAKLQDQLANNGATQNDETGITDLTPDDEAEFRQALNEIPQRNDDGCGNGNFCTYDEYRNRSSRVATQLRKAAKLLPA